MKGQRGCIVEKGNRYFIKFRTCDGKQKMQGRKPGRGFDTYEQAQERLHEVLNDINKGDYVELKSIKFEAFASQWVKDRVSICGSTESSYASSIRQHLNPALGHLRVHDIRLDTVQRLVTTLRPKVSVKTLHNCMTLLRVMLVGRKGPSAIKLGYIRHDPTLGVELPSKAPTRVQPPTTTEVWKLYETAEAMSAGSPSAQVAAHAILLDAFTGLRRGEILALQYQDIDWFAKEIVVSRSVSKVRAEDGVRKWVWRLGPTKNGRVRRIGIGQKVLAALANLKQASADKSGIIFTPKMAGVEATPYPFIDPDHFDTYVYGPVATNAGLGRVRFHDLRHFFASMLIAQGENPKYVCDQMGHSTIKMTFDTYGHLFPQARQEASARLEESIFKQRKPASVELTVENGAVRASRSGGVRTAN